MRIPEYENYSAVACLLFNPKPVLTVPFSSCSEELIFFSSISQNPSCHGYVSLWIKIPSHTWTSLPTCFPPAPTPWQKPQKITNQDHSRMFSTPHRKAQIAPLQESNKTIIPCVHIFVNASIPDPKSKVPKFQSMLKPTSTTLNPMMINVENLNPQTPPPLPTSQHPSYMPHTSMYLREA